MIDKVNNISNKSFKDFTGPSESFNEKNLIFGYNGRGKSSLAKGIIEEGFKVSSIADSQARLFDKDYIKKNLYLEDNEKIRGVVANFGEKTIDAEEKINELIEMKYDTSVLVSKNSELKDEIRSLIDEIHNRRKGNTNITRKNSSYTLDQLIDSYENDLKKASKIEGNEEALIEIKGDNSLEREKKELTAIEIEKLNVEGLMPKLENINNIFKKEFDDIVIPSSEIIEWLNKGVVIHNEDEECKFCGNPLDLTAIKRKIDLYNINEKQKSIIALKEFKEDLTYFINTVQNLIENKTKLELFLHLEDKFEILKSKNYLLKESIVSIDEKIKDIHFCETFPIDEVKNSLTIIKSTREDISKMKKEVIDGFEMKIRNQEQLVKGAIALEIDNNQVIQEKIKSFRLKEQEIKSKMDENDGIDTEIQNYEEEKSDITDFAIHLNHVLEDINVALRLELDESKKNYILKHAYTDEFLVVDDISEGEKNLLALLFYYFDLYYDDNQEELKREIKLIVIDDPVSSMDEQNRFYVMELMKNILDEAEVQIFIMTHVWNDFCDLAFGKEKKHDYKFFEVFKNINGESLIRSLKIHDKPYKKLFKEIYFLSEKTRDEILSDCEVYHLPNSMRRVLEEFLSFKSPNGITPTKQKQKAIENIFKITSNTQKTKLGQLLTLCNVMSHSTRHNPEEIWKSAKFLMNQIKEIDHCHYLAMRGTN
ncbi:AAA family ATPase [Salinicoccus carnicancri]|uniref:AAA family ATPase n=1 Tax=Salinicoccus carnicancri TaxID=558170 RepID=UPI00030B18B0|nr:AAA family ATPase [Salinicoccus carnicancri]